MYCLQNDEQVSSLTQNLAQNSGKRQSQMNQALGEGKKVAIVPHEGDFKNVLTTEGNVKYNI